MRSSRSCLLLLSMLSNSASTEAFSLSRVSVNSAGEPANGSALSPTITADGRYVVFQAAATNLASGDTNGVDDVFLHDRQSGETIRVSVGPQGQQANGVSLQPTISPGGRFIAYVSAASNLLWDDFNGSLRDIYVLDRETGGFDRVEVGAKNRVGYALSDDGRYVIFDSERSDLVADDTNGRRDVFLHDLQLNTTTRVSLDNDGRQLPYDSTAGTVSNNGYFVTFETPDGIMLRNRIGKTTTRIDRLPDGTNPMYAGFSPVSTPDGRYIAYLSDAPGLATDDTDVFIDAFVFDRVTGATERVSVSSTGEGGNSNSGERFWNPEQRQLAISPDGRYVAFRSFASNLIADDTNGTWDVFVRDRWEGKTLRASRDENGQQVSGRFYAPSVSLSGKFVAFHSNSAGLVAADTNSYYDVFVADLSTPAATPIPKSNIAPIADAGLDQEVFLHNTVSLDGGLSHDADGDPLTYAWTLTAVPEGSTAALSDPSYVAPYFIADKPGSYTVRLIVNDGEADSEPDFVTITTLNMAPTADAGPDHSTYEGQTVILDGSQSHDPEGYPLVYKWSLESAPYGSTAALSGLGSATPSLTVDVAGTYVVSLIVNDGVDDSAPDYVTINVATREQEAQETLRELVDKVRQIPPAALKNGNQATALNNKFAEVQSLIDRGRIDEAISKLENDILKKTDGCANEGSVDRNDWITSCEQQAPVYGEVVRLMEILRSI